MDINPDARARILAAADQLFEQAGRATFPTVDAVRRLSKTNMNDASAAMREWRRGQAATATPVAVAVPSRVQQSFQAALAALWAEAQESANEALRASQAAFEAEREESEALRGEMAAAFENQTAELEALQARFAELEAQAGATAADLAEAHGKLAGATGRADSAEARAEEIEKRVGDLKAVLAQAQDAARADASRLDAALAELATALARTEAEQQARAEETRQAAERTAKAEAERDQARQEAAAAREEAAHTRGQLETAQAQQTALLAVLQGPEGKPEDTRKAAMVGAAILAKVERGEWPKDKMLAMMDATLTEADERALFSLDGKKTGEGGKPAAKPRAAKARNLDIEDPRS
jgi:colicin import membrane protein